MSVLAPSERMVHRLKARLQALQQHPPSEAQLEYLKALGDRLSAPQTMAEASERIEALKAQRSNAPAWTEASTYVVERIVYQERATARKDNT